MKLKKWVALATAAAMCLSMTACSVSVSTNETTKAAEPSAETTAAEAGDKEESGEAAESAAEGDLVATADYPTKPITMIIPYAAGGTTDVWGRKLAALIREVFRTGYYSYQPGWCFWFYRFPVCKGTAF